MRHLFTDRFDAGKKLAEHLVRYRHVSNGIVLALPRGGVPVAYEVARALELPLELILVRKLGFPGQEELALGAITSGGLTVFNEELAQRVPPETIDELIREETRDLARREVRYRGEIPYPELRGKTIIVVDDGIATGASTRACLVALNKMNPERLIVAVPVAPTESCEDISGLSDELVCLGTPPSFESVGEWYADFSQVTDEEVVELMKRARRVSRSAPLDLPER
jgi:predicted phosphoribosyltransferase